MAWGESFLSAWDSATGAARDAVASAAAGVKDAAKWAAKKTSEAANWAKEKAGQAADWAKEKAAQAAEAVSDAADWVKDKAVQFGRRARDAYRVVKDKFSEVADAAKQVFKCTLTHVSDCWDQAVNITRPAPIEPVDELIDATHKKAWEEAIDTVTDPKKVAEIKKALSAKTLRGKSARVGNLIDSGAKFDGRSSGWSNMINGSKQLMNRSAKEVAGDAWSTGKTSFNGAWTPKALGISALVSGGFKLHERGWDVRALSKKDYIEVGYDVVAGTGYGAAGAAIGTLIPIPVVGTVAGFLVGTAVGAVVDSYFKEGALEFLDCIT